MNNGLKKYIACKCTDGHRGELKGIVSFKHIFNPLPKRQNY